MAIQISVIIPTYAPKDYLWECLDSLNSQTLPKSEYEVILALNGDRDPYEQEISHRLGGYSFASQLLYSAPSGVSGARNLGLDNARGRYICFVDDDDWLSEGYLEGLLRESSKEGIVVSNVTATDEDTPQEIDRHFLSLAYKNYQPTKETSLYANRSFFSTVWGKLIPMACIGSQRFDTHIVRGEDSIFMFAISWRIKHVKAARHDCAYHVRVRHGSAGRRSIDTATKWLEFLSQSLKYTMLYARHIRHISPRFYLSRIAGTFYNKMIQKH